MRYEPSYSKMSTENIHGTPPISRENDHVETNINNQPQTMLGSSGPQNEDGSQCAGLSQADGSGDISDQAAAETLVQFRDQISHEANQNGVLINGDTIRQQERSMQYGSTGFWQQRPGSNNHVNQQQTAQRTQASGHFIQNDNINPDLNLQNVIFGMSRSLSTMQQNQELFECALQNMVTVLQEMRKFASTTNSQREASSISAQSTVPNVAPQNPQRQVVSDGSNTRQSCQRNSSFSYAQENESATLVPRADRNMQLAQDSGQPDTASYRTYEVDRYVARPANITTDETSYRRNSVPLYEQISREESSESMDHRRNDDPMYRQDSTGMRENIGATVRREDESIRNTNSTRDKTGYVMTQSDYNSAGQLCHTQSSQVDTSNSTSVAMDRTGCRGNILETTVCNGVVYQPDRAAYRQQETSVPQYIEQRVNKQASVCRNSTDCDTTNKTVNRDIDMPNYRQDNRMNHERDSFQSNTDRRYTTDERYQRQTNGRHSSYTSSYGIKLPSFDGKEDWRVWISRFEEIAERRNWDNHMKLDNLLPKLQGRAGDFVFTQLPKYTLRCYSQLVKELNSRFRVVETKRKFASKFSQRVQKENETVEEYAADLKRLYSKAYQQRDAKTRQEDLVRKFLDGLKDNDARFEIEYNKEPEDIDEAVYHAVNFIQTKRRSKSDTFLDRKLKKYARRATEDKYYDTDEECCSDTEEPEHVYRVPQKSERPVTKNPKSQEVKSEKDESESEIQLKLLTETRDLIQTLVTQITAKANGQQGTQISQTRNNQRRGGVVCFKCNEEGHVIRDCPRKTARTDDANSGDQSRNPVSYNRPNNENPVGSLN